MLTLGHFSYWSLPLARTLLRGESSNPTPKGKGQPRPHGCPPLKRCALYQAVRLPVKGKEPNEPALTLPDSLSPSTVPAKSRVRGRGLVILADQLTLLPSTLPFSNGPEPCCAVWVPVRLPPLVVMSKAAFCAPKGELMTISHLPSTAMLFSSR